MSLTAAETTAALMPSQVPVDPGRHRTRNRNGREGRGGAASLFAFIPIGFLIVFGGLPIVLSLLLVLGHLGGLNSAVSELGQNEVAGHGIGTLQAITNTIASPGYLKSVVATLIVLGITSAVVLLGGATLTIWHRLRPSRPTAILQFVSVIPLFIPVVIASFALWDFWGDRGFADSLGHDVGLNHVFVFASTIKGVVLAEVWVSLPFAVLLLRSGLGGLSQSSLDAARDAGAGAWSVASRIVLPQIRRELTIVFCFTAVGVLGSFTVPYIIGPASPLMLGVNAVETFTAYNEPQQAAVIGFTIFVFAGFIGCLYALGTRRRRVRVL